MSFGRMLVVSRAVTTHHPELDSGSSSGKCNIEIPNQVQDDGVISICKYCHHKESA